MTFLGQALQWFLDGSHWQGDFGIPNRLFEHLTMSGISLLAAAVIALPIGITLGHFGRGGNLDGLRLLAHFQLKTSNAYVKFRAEGQVPQPCSRECHAARDTAIVQPSRSCRHTRFHRSCRAHDPECFDHTGSIAGLPCVWKTR